MNAALAKYPGSELGSRKGTSAQSDSCEAQTLGKAQEHSVGGSFPAQHLIGAYIVDFCAPAVQLDHRD